MNNIIELKNIQKYYKIGKEKLHVLKSIDLSIEHGEFVMIMGRSGSGKTTLLNILGFLDKFDNGEYIFNGKNVSTLNDDKRCDFRNKNIGFVFQQFNLINNLNIYQNIELPLIYSGAYSKKERLKIIKEKLSLVGLLDKIKQYPMQLSGGQQQRIAIARALVNDPHMIFADEPTGSLDSKTEIEIMDILKNLNKSGKTIVMVTHDECLIKYATKVIDLKDGVFVKEDAL